MNQEMISYLSTCYDELSTLNEKLYTNPEDSYKEFLACDSICNLLESHEFDDKKNFLHLRLGQKRCSRTARKPQQRICAY